MRLTESERAENREALAAMSLPQKLDHLFEYYKFPLVLILIAVVGLGSVLYYRLTRKDALLYVAYANIAVGDTMDAALGQGFARESGANPARAEVKLYRNLYLSRDASVQNHEYAYASQLKVMAAMANGQLDVLLMNREAFDIMSTGGYLLPLEPFLAQDAALSARIADRLVENTVILEDNDIEHRLDESIPYQAVTEEVANGILLSAFPLFERADFSGDVYLGVVGNSARQDVALLYIDYLTAEPTDAA
ncbi:MAG: hypothetical protein Q4C10_05820 [Clostridia bacterium]|nr:hypothetical protein [Clostridia bacterium]